MNFIPNAAIAVATVALLAIGLCLAHMISSRRQDARLQFLLNLMPTFPASGDQSETPQMDGSLQAVPLRNVVETPRPEERRARRPPGSSATGLTGSIAVVGCRVARPGPVGEGARFQAVS